MGGVVNEIFRKTVFEYELEFPLAPFFDSIEINQGFRLGDYSSPPKAGRYRSAAGHVILVRTWTKQTDRPDSLPECFWRYLWWGCIVGLSPFNCPPFDNWEAWVSYPIKRQDLSGGNDETISV
jgi:hypothetical protein